jgi:hypothetical protein
MTMKTLKWFCFMLLLAASACTSSKITRSWKAENVVPKHYNKILVLGLINDADKTIREKMEEHIVGDLKTLGYTAVCSCEEFDPKTFENMNEQQALDKLGKSGIDAVLTVVLLNKAKVRSYVPARQQTTPYGMYQEQFWGYYKDRFGLVFTPGYIVEDTQYFWETNFYELETRNLLYSAQSQSFDPNSAQALGHEYGQMIVKNMVKKHVVKKQVELLK